MLAKWLTKVKYHMERYRSGHNGADSKSVCAQAHEGSNPSLSANKNRTFVYRQMFCQITDKGFRTTVLSPLSYFTGIMKYGII